MRFHESLVSICYRPRMVLDHIREKPSWFFVAVLVGVCFLGPLFIETYVESDYLNSSAILELQLQEMAAQGISEATIEELRAAASANNASTAGAAAMNLAYIVWVVVALGAAVYVLLLAPLYFKLMAALLRANVPFSAFVALSIWAQVPTAWLAWPDTGLCLAIHGATCASVSHSIFSIGYWVGLTPSSGELLRLLGDFLSVGTIWPFVLMVIGFKTWTKRGVIPVVLIVGVPVVVLPLLWIQVSGFLT
ncbi:MAG: hypothetical protein F4W90_11500 [Gammaproteobacteria bacterium]|nr:hypothetical protein [Gammaproteobacteria bacterium]